MCPPAAPCMSRGIGPSSGASLAMNAVSWARTVAFLSLAHNLVTGDTNGDDVADVFVRDLKAGTTAEVRTGHGAGPPVRSTDRPADAGLDWCPGRRCTARPLAI